MYCKCDKPKKKIIRIEHKDVDVCAKSIGGCGCEITHNPCASAIGLDADYRFKSDCIVCTGTGITFDWMSGQTCMCLNCNGKGYV